MLLHTVHIRGHTDTLIDVLIGHAILGHEKYSIQTLPWLGKPAEIFLLRGGYGDFGLFDSGLVDGAIEIFELCAFQICFDHQKILT